MVSYSNLALTCRDPFRLHTFAHTHPVTGTVFGWAPMLLVLKDEGLMSDMCSPSEPWCEARMVGPISHGQSTVSLFETNRNPSLTSKRACQESLAFIFTVAAVMYSASGIGVGYFLDTFGPAACVALACGLSVSGFFLFGMYMSPWMPRWMPGQPNAELNPIPKPTKPSPASNISNLNPQTQHL